MLWSKLTVNYVEEIRAGIYGKPLGLESEAWNEATLLPSKRYVTSASWQWL